MGFPFSICWKVKKMNFSISFLLLALDAYLFFALRHLFKTTAEPVSALVLTIFGLLSLVTILYLGNQVSSRQMKFREQSKNLILAALIGSYIAKLVGAAFLLLDDLKRIVSVILNAIFSLDLETNRSIYLSGGGLVFGLVIFILLVYGIVRNRHRYRVREISVPIKDLPHELEELRIVQLSDIHAGSFQKTDPILNGVEKINALNPDVVFFTGDLVNNVADEIDPYVNVFNQIKSKYGVFSILGNHDYGDYVRWNSMEAKELNLRTLFQRHAELGWELLNNEHRYIQIGNARVGIIGVENYSAHPRFPKYGDLKQATSGYEHADVNILLSHDPTHWDDEVTTQYQFIDLTLSGHTHGFQFGFEWTKKIRWSPVQYVYRKWAGLYEMAGQYLYVNRGFGYLGYPGRVGILPEITLLKLKKES